MKAYAPGKLVLSGAYSVLEGAPAIVSAVDRYVCSDSSRPASLVTPELLAVLPAASAPDFDASALRSNGRKLGLGSSAAILVACLAAADCRQFKTDQQLRHAIFSTALAAHRRAQGGGSGIDVAASTWGGTLIATTAAVGGLRLEPATLPIELVVEAWTSPVSASTPQLLTGIQRFKGRAPTGYAALIAELQKAAERAAAAVRGGQALDLVAALEDQRTGLSSLGRCAGVPIVTAEAERLAQGARSLHATALSSGAGGGDIVLWVSDRPSPLEFRELAHSLGHDQLELRLHARGLHRCVERDATSAA